MPEFPIIHLTVKWSTAGPEIMANLYGDTAADIAANLAELRALIEEQIPALRAEQVERPRVADEDWPTCPNERCDRYGEPMLNSNYSGQFCPGNDDSEVGGKCRWVRDHRGLRRKPTRAELDARAAAGGRR